MAKKPWGGAGAWAAESELADSQLEQEESHHHHHHHQQQTPLVAADAAFPSLGEAAHTKVSKKKKQTVSLAEFHAGRTPSFSESKGLTTEEKMALPTGPRDRSGEEQVLGGLGGGFKDYGGYRGESRDREYGRDHDGGYGSRRSDLEGGFGRGSFLGDRDGFDEPSRADTVDDWGASKKLAPPPRGRFEDDGSRYGGRLDDRDFPSKADEDNHWGSSKKYVAAPPSDGGRRTSKYDFPSSRVADEADSWGAAKKSVAPTGGYDHCNSKEKDGADLNLWTHKDAERAIERPRLVLQPRTQPVDSAPCKEDMENQPPVAEFPSEVTSKPRKVNPFGEAKPREVILAEKGLNWKKLDSGLEQKPSDRGEAQDSLKAEIKAIQEALKLMEGESSESDGSKKIADLKEQLSRKEGELDELSTEVSGGFWGGGERNRNSDRDSDIWSRRASNGGATSERKGSRW